MHRFLLFWATTVLFLAIGLHSSTAADAVSDDRLQGKWEVSKTNDEGQKYKQIVEIRGDELHFTIVGEDGQTYIRAVGDLSLEKAHDLHIMKVSNIKAGGPEGDLELPDGFGQPAWMPVPRAELFRSPASTTPEPLLNTEVLPPDSA